MTRIKVFYWKLCSTDVGSIHAAALEFGKNPSRAIWQQLRYKKALFGNVEDKSSRNIPVLGNVNSNESGSDIFFLEKKEGGDPKVFVEARKRGRSESRVLKELKQTRLFVFYGAEMDKRGNCVCACACCVCV